MGEGLLQPTHLILILVIVMIIFGAGKLPEVGGALGKGISEFKQSIRDEPAPPLTPGSAPVKPAASSRPIDVPAARPDDV